MHQNRYPYSPVYGELQSSPRQDVVKMSQNPQAQVVKNEGILPTEIMDRIFQYASILYYPFEVPAPDVGYACDLSLGPVYYSTARHDAIIKSHIRCALMLGVVSRPWMQRSATITQSALDEARVRINRLPRVCNKHKHKIRPLYEHCKDCRRCSGDQQVEQTIEFALVRAREAVNRILNVAQNLH